MVKLGNFQTPKFPRKFTSNSTMENPREIGWNASQVRICDFGWSAEVEFSPRRRQRTTTEIHFFQSFVYFRRWFWRMCVFFFAFLNFYLWCCLQWNSSELTKKDLSYEWHDMTWAPQVWVLGQVQIEKALRTTCGTPHYWPFGAWIFGWTKWLTRWWFQRFFLFSPSWGTIVYCSMSNFVQVKSMNQWTIAMFSGCGSRKS